MTVLAQGARGARSEDVRRGQPLHPAALRPRARADRAQPSSPTVLGLNRSTIGDLTGELVAAGLVREEPGRAERVHDRASSSGGRPSYVVTPESERVQVLAVDVGVTHLTVARIGLGGAVLSRVDRSLPPRRPAAARRDRDHRQGRRRAARRGRQRRSRRRRRGGRARHGAPPRRPGAPGANLGWKDAPVGAELAAALGPAGVGGQRRRPRHPGRARARRRGRRRRRRLPLGALRASAPASSRAGSRSAAAPDMPGRSGTPWSTPAGCPAIAAPRAAGRPSAARSASSSWRGDRWVVAWPGCARWPPQRPAAIRWLARRSSTSRAWLGRGTANVVNVAQPGGRHPRRRPRGGVRGGRCDDAGRVRDRRTGRAAEQVRIVTPHLG